MRDSRSLRISIGIAISIVIIATVSLTVPPLSKYTMGEVILDAEGKIGGYNDVNTVIYAILLCLTALLVYYLLDYFKIRIKEEQLYSIIPLLISGSLLRVCEDTNQVLYHVPLITPFIYILLGGYLILAILAIYSGKDWIQVFLLVSFSFLLSTFFGDLWYTLPPLFLIPILIRVKKDKPYHRLSILLSAPLVSGASFLLAFSLHHGVPDYFMKVVGLAALVIGISVASVEGLCRYLNLRGHLPLLPAVGESIDGTSAFVGVTQLGYVEKHVVSRWLLSIHPAFYLAVKIGIGIFFGVALYWIAKKREEISNLSYIVLFFIGFLSLSPGLRSFLRIVLGTRSSLPRHLYML